jgi:hypothetical protein
LGDHLLREDVLSRLGSQRGRVDDRRAVADWEDGTRAMGGEGDVRDRRELWGREKMLWGGEELWAIWA